MNHFIQWVNDNTGVMLAAISLLFSVLIYRRDRTFASALEIKDATIEHLRTKNETLEKVKEEYERYKERTERQEKLNNKTLEILHKRISELEASQLFELKPDGRVALKSYGLVKES